MNGHDLGDWVPADGSLIVKPKNNGARARCSKPGCANYRDKPTQRYCRSCRAQAQAEYRARQNNDRARLQRRIAVLERRLFHVEGKVAHET